MMKRREFQIKWSWHGKGTIRAVCVVFHSLLGSFADKKPSVELLIMKVLFSFMVPLFHCRNQKLPLVNSLLRN